MKQLWKYNTKLYGDEAKRRAAEDPLFAEAIEETKNREIMNAIMPYFMDGIRRRNDD